MGDRKILVVGSNSFSGASFVEAALAQGYKVAGISRSKEPHAVFLPYKWPGCDNPENFSFFQYDLNHDLDRIMDLIHDFTPGFIVNFAAQSMVGQSWEKPQDWFMTNVVSTINFHDKIRSCGFLEKYVHVSTPEVYGSCEGLVKENLNYNPSTPYAVSRAAADMSLMTFFNNYDFPVVFTRAANVYGPGQQLYRIIPRAVLFFHTGQKISLHGGGVSVRSFIHIKDVAKGTLKAMAHAKPGGIFHFSTTENISIRALVEKIALIMGVDFNDHVEVAPERPGKDSAYLLDAGNARDTLGWQDAISLEQGIKETIDWVREHIDALQAQPLDYIHQP